MLISRTSLRIAILGSLGWLCSALAGVAWPQQPSSPLALHPDNPHYFLWRGKPTVLITSGEHYGAVLNLDFDYVQYLDALAAHGLNHTRTFSGVYREIPGSFGITDNPLAPKPQRFACPWARSDQPGYFDGGMKFDLTRWDPDYFERLKDFLAQARRRGVVVEFTLFCPMYNDQLWQACPLHADNNVNGVGRCQREEVYALRHADLTEIQLAFTRKVVQELRDFDNLYYEVCNEPYFGGVTREWQHKIVDTIVEAERDFPARHLISLNVANGRQKVERPHPAVSIFNFHYCVPPDTVAMNYGLNKVIGENETGFRGSHDVLYRTEGWDFLLAGGGLYNNLDYSFTPQHPGGTLREYRSPGGGSPELRRQLQILHEFLGQFDFVRMAPDVQTVRKTEPDLSVQVLAERGKAYAIYLHVPLVNKPKDLAAILQRKQAATLEVDLPAGTYSAQWLDPVQGQATPPETFRHAGGPRRMASPAFQVDIALRIVADRP
jgi:hypothetical protein